MAIADTITSMQNHTSNAYTMIGYGTDLTGINKNLENLSTSIFNAFLEALRTPDTLFTNLPKKSASGSNISLNNTANAPMRITLQPSELTQASTPTPSSPQDIHTISKSNKVVVCGKNFLSGIEQGTLDSSGQPTSSSTAIRSKNYDLVEPSTQYTFSMNGTSGGVNVAEYTSNKTFISYTFSGGTFTTSATTRYIKISKTGTTSDTYQIEKGSTATTYEPYTSQEADIDLGVENLCKPIDTVTRSGITFTNNGDGSYTLNGTSTGATSFYVTGLNIPAGTYTFCAYNSTIITNGAFYFQVEPTANDRRKTFTEANAKMTFTTTATTTAWSVIVPSGITLNNFTIYPQLEVGSVAHPFSKYGVEPIEYCKIGTYENKFIRTSGKNLLNETLFTTTGSYNIDSINNGVVVSSSMTGYAGARLAIGNEITIPANTDIYISFKLKGDASGDYFNTIQLMPSDSNVSISGATETKILVPSVSSTYQDYKVKLVFNKEISFAKLFFQHKSSTATAFTITNIMVSTENTSYEPYGTNTWYIKKNIGKVVLDGTEDYVKRSDIPNLTNTSCYRTSIDATINSNALANTPQVCTRFTCLNNTNDEEHVRYTGAENYRFQIFIDKTRLGTDDASGMKNWATNNNFTIYYVLATPTYTQITGTLAKQLEYVYQKLLSYSGTTNISQVNNDLPFIMNVSAIEV